MNIRYTRCVLAPVVFAVGTLSMLVLPHKSVKAQSSEEWYIPKPTSTGAAGTLETGLRLQFSSDDESGLETERWDFIPNARFGVSDDIELYAEIPVTLVEQDVIDFLDVERKGSAGVGDLFVQGSYRFAGDVDWNLLGSIDVVLPTGENPFDNAVGTGSGFYAVSAGVTAVKIADPVILFAGIGYEHRFERQFDTVTVTPSDAVRFQLGANVVLNPRLSIGIFSASDIRTTTQINGAAVQGSDNNQVRVGANIGYQFAEDLSLTSNIVVGATDAANDAVISVGVNKSW